MLRTDTSYSLLFCNSFFHNWIWQVGEVNRAEYQNCDELFFKVDKDVHIAQAGCQLSAKTSKEIKDLADAPTSALPTPLGTDH